MILRTYKGLIHNLDVFASSFFYGWVFVKMGCAGITCLSMVQWWCTDQFTFIYGIIRDSRLFRIHYYQMVCAKICLQVLMLFGGFVGTLIYLTATPISPLFWAICLDTIYVLWTNHTVGIHGANIFLEDHRVIAERSLRNMLKALSV